MVEERVSIRDLRAILEALSTVAATEKDPLNLTEFVRAQLRRATTYRLTSGATELSVFLLDAAIEEAIRRAITRTAAGSFLTLAPAAGRDVVAAIRRALVAGAVARRATCILTQPDIRRFVRKLIEVDLPETTVVSFAELLARDLAAPARPKRPSSRHRLTRATSVLIDPSCLRDGARALEHFLGFALEKRVHLLHAGIPPRSCGLISSILRSTLRMPFVSFTAA